VEEEELASTNARRCGDHKLMVSGAVFTGSMLDVMQGNAAGFVSVSACGGSSQDLKA